MPLAGICAGGPGVEVIHTGIPTATGSEMVTRCAATVLLNAEKKFRRIKGFQEMSLQFATLRNPMDTEEVAAYSCCVTPSNSHGTPSSCRRKKPWARASFSF